MAAGKSKDIDESIVPILISLLQNDSKINNTIEQIVKKYDSRLWNNLLGKILYALLAILGIILGAFLTYYFHK